MRTETFATPGQVSLDLRLPHGDIELETHDLPETRVELEGRGGRGREIVEEAVVEHRVVDGRHEVTVDVERRGFGFGLVLGRGDHVRMSVRAPHGADVRAASAAGDVRGRGRFGRAAVKTAAGDVAFDEVERDASFKSASGDVRVDSVGGSLEVQSAAGDVQARAVGGSVEVKSASGDVSVGEAGGDVSVQTMSGDTRIEAVAEGAVNVKSVSGDVVVGVRRGSRLWIDAKTVTGDARSELELDDSVADEEGPLVELRATAMSGDIRVVRAS